MIIDDTIMNWLIGSVVVGVPSIGGGIVVLWRKFIAFIGPKVSEAFREHTELVAEMRKNVPVVSNTMNSMAVTLQALGETQKAQCDDLERHSKLHVDHGQKLDTIIKRLSVSELNQTKDGN